MIVKLLILAPFYNVVRATIYDIRRKKMNKENYVPQAESGTGRQQATKMRKLQMEEALTSDFLKIDEKILQKSDFRASDGTLWYSHVDSK